MLSIIIDLEDQKCRSLLKPKYNHFNPIAVSFINLADKNSMMMLKILGRYESSVLSVHLSGNLTFPFMYMVSMKFKEFHGLDRLSFDIPDFILHLRAFTSTVSGKPSIPKGVRQPIGTANAPHTEGIKNISSVFRNPSPSQSESSSNTAATTTDHTGMGCGESRASMTVDHRQLKNKRANSDEEMGSKTESQDSSVSNDSYTEDEPPMEEESEECCGGDCMCGHAHSDDSSEVDSSSESSGQSDSEENNHTCCQKRRHKGRCVCDGAEERYSEGRTSKHRLPPTKQRPIHEERKRENSPLEVVNPLDIKEIVPAKMNLEAHMALASMGVKVFTPVSSAAVGKIIEVGGLGHTFSHVTHLSFHIEVQGDLDVFKLFCHKCPTITALKLVCLSDMLYSFADSISPSELPNLREVNILTFSGNISFGKIVGRRSLKKLSLLNLTKDFSIHSICSSLLAYSRFVNEGCDEGNQYPRVDRIEINFEKHGLFMDYHDTGLALGLLGCRELILHSDFVSERLIGSFLAGLFRGGTGGIMIVLPNVNLEQYRVFIHCLISVATNVSYLVLARPISWCLRHDYCKIPNEFLLRRIYRNVVSEDVLKGLRSKGIRLFIYSHECHETEKATFGKLHPKLHIIDKSEGTIILPKKAECQEATAEASGEEAGAN